MTTISSATSAVSALTRYYEAQNPAPAAAAGTTTTSAAPVASTLTSLSREAGSITAKSTLIFFTPG